MSSTFLPFLYRTRTIQQAWHCPLRFMPVRQAHSKRVPRDSSVPFDFEAMAESRSDQQESTITPQEAAIFKDIFDEIANGQMPLSKKPSEEPGALWTMPNKKARPGHHQERMRAFREQFLQRYPASLRRSAQSALGTYDPSAEDAEEDIAILEENRTKQLLQMSVYENARREEWARVSALMNEAVTDAKLWSVLKQEVFKLPAQIGLVTRRGGTKLAEGDRKPKKRAKMKKGAEAATTAEVRTADATEATPVVAAEEPIDSEAVRERQRMEMNVQGLLYPQYLVHALNRFDTAFDFPSPYIFQILPHLKSLGLPAYILGVSTPFYTALARIHWYTFGDAHAALDTLQEINATGLNVDKEVIGFLNGMRKDMHKCAWGGQGEVVMSIMQGAKDGDAVEGRLDWLLGWARKSLGNDFDQPAEAV